MHEALTEFFRAGQNFRRTFSRGNYLVIDPDPVTGDALRLWLERGDIRVSLSRTIWNEGQIFAAHPRCIVVNADGLNRFDLYNHLKYVDQEFPEIAEVIHSRDTMFCAEIEGAFPRITVIRRGEGLEGVLVEMGGGFSMTRNAG